MRDPDFIKLHFLAWPLGGYIFSSILMKFGKSGKNFYEKLDNEKNCNEN